MERGSIYIADLNPTIGHEQAGIRPVVVMSVENFNNSFLELVVICPLTTKSKNFPSHVEITNSELKEKSFVKCEDIRSISKERLLKKIGILTNDEIQKIEKIIEFIVGI